MAKMSDTIFGRALLPPLHFESRTSDRHALNKLKTNKIISLSVVIKSLNIFSGLATVAPKWTHVMQCKYVPHYWLLAVGQISRASTVWPILWLFNAAAKFLFTFERCTRPTERAGFGVQERDAERKRAKKERVRYTSWKVSVLKQIG